MMTSINDALTNLQYWIKTPASNLDALFKQARAKTDEVFHRQVTLYTPGQHFPSISITGKQCDLHCQHCAGRFLHHMQSITSPSDLLSFCQKLAQKNGVGCLISGGCDSTGTIPLSPFLPVLKEIKETTNLFLNVHTGFLTNSEARDLAQTGIDCASVDVIGDEATLHSIYGLTDRTINDYASTLIALDKNKLAVAPHICVGLYHGQLVGELAALQLIKAILKPRLLVIIALMPTQGTPMAKTRPTSPSDVARICAIARLLFPKCEIALGCMRPRGVVRRKMEILAVKAGVNRLVLPTKTTMKYLEKNDYLISTQKACCVI